MKKISFLFLLCSYVAVKSQSTFQKAYTQGNSTVSDIVYVNEHNTTTLMLANYTDNTTGTINAAITKFTTSTGNVTSTKQFSLGQNFVEIKTAAKKNSSLYIGAAITGTLTEDDYVYKYNLSTNAITWCKQLNVDQTFSIHALTNDNTKNIYVLGSFYNTASNTNDFLLVKMDTLGTLLWTKAFGATSRDETLGQIIYNGPRELYISSVTFTHGPFGSPTLIRLDTAGNILNTMAFVTTTSPRFGSSYISMINDKVAFVNGTIIGSSDPGPTLINLVDSNLTVIDSQIISGIDVKQINTNATNLLLTGQAPITSGFPGFRSIRYDNSLNLLGANYFQKISSYSIAGNARAFINTNNQSIHAFKPGGNDSLFVVKTDSYESVGCRDTIYVPNTTTFSYTSTPYYYSDYTYTATVSTSSLVVTTVTTAVTGICSAITTSILNKDGAANDVLLFPNPTSSTLHIQSTGNFTASKITIIDMFSKELLVSVGSDRVDLSALAKGIYFAVLVDDKTHKTLVKKVIKD